MDALAFLTCCVSLVPETLILTEASCPALLDGAGVASFVIPVVGSYLCPVFSEADSFD